MKAIDKIKAIQGIFGLCVAQLEKITFMPRRKIYAWLDGEKPDEIPATRIDQIYRIALDWKNLSPYHFPPGIFMRDPLIDGSSLLEALMQEPINESELQDYFKLLLALMQHKNEKLKKSAKIERERSESGKAQKPRGLRITRTIYSCPDS